MNAIERLRDALPPADHDPPCGLGRCAPHTDLATVEALYQAAKNMRYSPDANGGDVLVATDDFYALTAAVRRVEGN